MRLTFSQSLAEMLVSSDECYRLQKFKVVKGRELKAGQASKTGIYLTVSQKGIVLRASLIREVAEMHRDESRNIYEGILVG